MLKELLEPVDGVTPRALVIGHTDEERVVYLADSLTDQPLRVGDSLLLESRSGYVYERIPKSEVEELILEEVPDIDYGDIGGLARQIEQIRDAVELPFLHSDLFREYEPKGGTVRSSRTATERCGCGRCPTRTTESIISSSAPERRSVDMAIPFFTRLELGP